MGQSSKIGANGAICSFLGKQARYFQAEPVPWVIRIWKVASRVGGLDNTALINNHRILKTDDDGEELYRVSLCSK